MGTSDKNGQVPDVATVLEMAARTIGNAPDLDQPLMDAGLDLLRAIELRNVLQHSVGVALPSAFIFEASTVRLLTRHLNSGASQSAAPVMTPSTIANG